MMRTLICVLAGALAVGACFSDIEPIAPDLPECTRPQADTTGWLRVSQFQADPTGMGGVRVSYLVPATFEQTGPRSWERAGTAIGWEAGFGAPLDQPFPEMVHTGSCRARISGSGVVLDYGTIASGGPLPDAVIVTQWTSTAGSTAGSVLFHARMRNHTDRSLLEQMLWSVRISR